MKRTVDMSSNSYVFHNGMFGSLDATCWGTEIFTEVHAPVSSGHGEMKKKVEELSYKLSLLVLTSYPVGTRLDGGGSW